MSSAASYSVQIFVQRGGRAEPGDRLPSSGEAATGLACDCADLYGGAAVIAFTEDGPSCPFRTGDVPDGWALERA
jgi:hypothetical protein